MSLTRKEVKKFVDNPDNWEVIPGNQYVQVAKLKHPILCVMQIQRSYDRNQWKYILICSISRTELENLIYDWERV